jgi:hypothetical protein
VLADSDQRCTDKVKVNASKINILCQFMFHLELIHSVWLEEIVYVERLCCCGYNFVACCMHHSVIMDVPSAMLK